MTYAAQALRHVIGFLPEPCRSTRRHNVGSRQYAKCIIVDGSMSVWDDLVSNSSGGLPDDKLRIQLLGLWNTLGCDPICQRIRCAFAH